MNLGKFEFVGDLTTEQAEALSALSESLQNTEKWVTIECFNEWINIREEIINLREVATILEKKENTNTKGLKIILALDSYIGPEDRKFVVNFYDSEPTMNNSFFI